MLTLGACAGTLHGFGYSFSKPELHCFAISKGGTLKKDFPVSLPESTMQHDFAMTEDYVIFLDFPLIGNPEARPHSSMWSQCQTFLEIASQPKQVPASLNSALHQAASSTHMIREG